jgi:hypothetical protein
MIDPLPRVFVYRCSCGALEIAGTLDEIGRLRMGHCEGTLPVPQCKQCRCAALLVGPADVVDRDVVRRCPAHGLALRPWRRVGKTECPDSACMYAEPHVCELEDWTCDCPSPRTAHGSLRIKPGCQSCHIVRSRDDDAYQARLLAEGRIHEGDAQCIGRCFDRLAWDDWHRRLVRTRRGPPSFPGGEVSS